MPCADALSCGCISPRGAGAACVQTNRGATVCPGDIPAGFDYLAALHQPAVMLPPPPPPPQPAPAPYFYQTEAPPVEVMPMPFEIALQMETPRELLDTIETDWPVGSQAKLFAPFEVDRGLWVQPRLVSLFVKTSNGRWTSYPGNDVSYPTLAALALAAPVMEVYSPGQGQPPQTPEAPIYIENPEIIYPDDSPPDFIPLDEGPSLSLKTGRIPWLLIGAGAVAFWFFAGKRRG